MHNWNNCHLKSLSLPTAMMFSSTVFSLSYCSIFLSRCGYVYYHFSDAKTVWNFLMMSEIHHRSFIRIVDHTIKKSSRPFLWSLAFYLPSISLKTFYVAFIYDAFKPLYFRSFLSRKNFGFKIFSTFSKAPWSINQSINGRDVIEKWNRQR